jgi:hypothetical protein
MTDQRLMELWGDGTEFGMSPDMFATTNNEFITIRDVAMRFAAKVMEIEYREGYDDGWKDGVDSVLTGAIGG